MQAANSNWPNETDNFNKSLIRVLYSNMYCVFDTFYTYMLYITNNITEIIDKKMFVKKNLFHLAIKHETYLDIFKFFYAFQRYHGRIPEILSNFRTR